MDEIKLKIKKKLEFPLEADSITPDNFAGKTVAEIKKLPLYYATKKVTLGNFFDVSGKSTEVANTKIIMEGDLSNVKRIGEKMTGGEIEINSASRNIWIDHCEFFTDRDHQNDEDYYDGLLDIKNEFCK